MSYIFKQKLDLRDLAGLERSAKRVLLYQPEEYLASIYGRYLRSHDFEVRHCLSLDAVVGHMHQFAPHALIFSLEGSRGPVTIASLLSIKKNFPAALVVTIGLSTDANTLKQLMTAGIASHIDRKHSRPQDVAIVTKTLLSN